jgi:hypothetical protein
MSNDQVFDTLKKEIKIRTEKAFSNQLMNNLSKDMAERIRKRTRTGKGVDYMGADPRPLNRLKSEAYVKARARRANRTKTTPRKSNLTFTGQLLDSISGRSLGVRKFLIYLKENRNDGERNSDIAEYQERQGRKFLYFSKPEIKAIYNYIRRYLKKEFKL